MELINYFPIRLRGQLQISDPKSLEEIRVRAGRPIEFCYADHTEIFSGAVKKEEILEMLNYLSGYSMYALAEECRKGFFTVQGGHRIGITGHVSCFGKKEEESQSVGGVYDVNGLNIRVAHEQKGCARELLPWLYSEGSIYHTLLVSPPGVGKTTFLRDCIRLISLGNSGREGLKVGVVDERSEIAACYQGIPQNDLGPRTDVLDNCPKEQGIRMLLRSMSPQVIAVDELGQTKDFEAVFGAVFSGSKILGTVHAEHVRELLAKPYMKELLEAKVIGRYVLLQKREDGSRSFCIYDSDMERLC